MKVLIDGEEVQVLRDVRIVQDIELEDGPGHMMIVINNEGMVTDVFEDKSGEMHVTGWSTYDDLVARCY